MPAAGQAAWVCLRHCTGAGWRAPCPAEGIAITTATSNCMPQAPTCIRPKGMPSEAPSAAPSTTLRAAGVGGLTLRCTAAGGEQGQAVVGSYACAATVLAHCCVHRPPPAHARQHDAGWRGSREYPKAAPAARPPWAASRKSRRPRYTPLNICTAGQPGAKPSVALRQASIALQAGQHARQHTGRQECSGVGLELSRRAAQYRLPVPQSSSAAHGRRRPACAS